MYLKYLIIYVSMYICTIYTIYVLLDNVYIVHIYIDMYICIIR